LTPACSIRPWLFPPKLFLRTHSGKKDNFEDTAQLGAMVGLDAVKVRIPTQMDPLQKAWGWSRSSKKSNVRPSWQSHLASKSDM
jgi:hypothetical protein